MSTSDEIKQIANSLILRAPEVYQKLLRLARDVRILERYRDEISAEKQAESMLMRRLSGEAIAEPILERGLRLVSSEGTVSDGGAG